MKTLSIFCFLFLILLLSCDMPSDPTENPKNARINLFMENELYRVPFGSTQNIGVAVLLPKHITNIRMWDSQNDLDTTFEYNSQRFDDTLFMSVNFYSEGFNIIYAEAYLKDDKIKEKTDSLSVFVLNAPDSIIFNEAQELFYTSIGSTKTIGFSIVTNCKHNIEYDFSSLPEIDTEIISLAHENDSVYISFSPEKTGNYSISLTAKCDSVYDILNAEIIVFEKLEFEEVLIPDTFLVGKKDTLKFIMQTNRDDTISCIFSNIKDFNDNIDLLIQSDDSLVFSFLPDTTDTFRFCFLLSNGYINDTVICDIFSFENANPWSKSKFALELLEGKETEIDLNQFLLEPILDSFAFHAEFGEITGSLWNWTPPWGCDTVKNCIIKATNEIGQFSFDLEFKIIPYDTSSPYIRFADPSIENGTVSSSNLSFGLIIQDTMSGINSVSVLLDSSIIINPANKDSLFTIKIENLEHNKPAYIQVFAEDNSIRKNKTELVFFIIYDSTYNDTTPPNIVQIFGPVNETRVTAKQDSLGFKIVDNSGIDSIYWTLNKTRFSEYSINKLGEYVITYDSLKYGHNTITIYAIDNSNNNNLDSHTVTIDYNTKITNIDLQEPLQNAINVDTLPLFRWSGGNDHDGDSVYFTLEYGLNDSNLHTINACCNCSVFTIPSDNKLSPFQTYYWRIIAFSKIYDDTVFSDIGTFKTCESNISIISQPPAHKIINIGDTVAISVETIGNPLNFQWKKNGIPIDNANSSTYTINSVSLEDSGSYSVDIFNKTDKVTSNPCNISIIYPVKVSAGYYHTLVIKNDGTLWGCGDNSNGQLGIDSQCSFNFVKVFSDVIKTAAGLKHSLILKNDGSLWVCGDNSFGQLGISNSSQVSRPKLVTENVKNIAAGANHTLVLKQDGILWACGNNEHGQLGNGNNEKLSKLDSITNDVKDIAAGETHSLILKNNGTVWSFGNNNRGQLGNGSYSSSNIPDSVLIYNVDRIESKYYYSFFHKNDGSFWASGDFEGKLDSSMIKTCHEIPIKITSDIKFVDVGAPTIGLPASNDGLILILKNNGSLHITSAIFLLNTESILKSDPIAVKVQSISAGKMNYFYIKENGNLWAWGVNSKGQLGNGTNNNIDNPLRVIPIHN